MCVERQTERERVHMCDSSEATATGAKTMKLNVALCEQLRLFVSE